MYTTSYEKHCVLHINHAVTTDSGRQRPSSVRPADDIKSLLRVGRVHDVPDDGYGSRARAYRQRGMTPTHDLSSSFRAN